MNPNDPNLPLLGSVARALGPLCERLVFVGGCAAGLLSTDTAVGPARVTRDVDAIVEVLSLSEYHELEQDLENAGFKHDTRSDAPVCRWLLDACVLDLMPTDKKILGFSNRWYTEAIRTATLVALPGGVQISLISPTSFFATKLEAFADRGNGDYRASHDLEDIISLINGLAELVNEIDSASGELRSFLIERSSDLLDEPQFLDAIPWHLAGDQASQALGRRSRTREADIASRLNKID